MNKIGVFICALIFVVSAQATNFQSDGLKEFLSDGCTSSPQGNWGFCCYEHDVRYWAGGSFEDRKRADEKLRWCINTVGGPGQVYYEFVRSGGLEYYGNAWPNFHRKGRISRQEVDAIEAEKRLWKNLGTPAHYDHIVLESTLFSPLTANEFQRLKQKFQPVLKTTTYKNFYRNYFQATRQEPSSKIFH